MIRPLILAALLASTATQASPPQPTPVTLAAFECGRLVQDDLGRFNDTFRFTGERREFIAGCFLIRHPKGVLLWDTGISPEMAAAMKGRATFTTPIADRAKALGVTITHVGLSHYHADHTGGAKNFPDAELLIGANDWAAVQGFKPDDTQRTALAPWVTDGGKVTPVNGDRDVFGDGSVMILQMPRPYPRPQRTAGPPPQCRPRPHQRRPVSFPRNRPVRGVPTFNADRAQTLASHDRFEEVAKVTKARVVIQHDPARPCATARVPQGARLMEPVTRIDGTAYPFGVKNVDTDIIIPAHWLKTTTRTGLGQGAFEAVRKDAGNVFDAPSFAGSPVLIAGENFGCGSSREHAAWALVDMGVRAVIAPSYSDIFSGNAVKNGIVPVVLPQAAIDRLMQVAREGQAITIDLDNMTVTTPHQDRFAFDLDAFRRQCLMEGLDEIGITLARDTAISNYEAQASQSRPWIAGGSRYASIVVEGAGRT